MNICQEARYPKDFMILLCQLTAATSEKEFKHQH